MSTPPSSPWTSVPLPPPDPILSISDRFRLDPSPAKLNLGVGAYRTSAGKPFVLPAVHAAAAELLADPDANHEYLPIDGLKPFTDAARTLVFGSPAAEQNDIVSVQALSGTGALRVAAEFLAAYYRTPAGGDAPAAVLIPDPTWPNHHAVFQAAGFAARVKYPYFSRDSNAVDFPAMTAALEAAEEGSVLVLHACAHNPTGADLTGAQWAAVREIAGRKRFAVIFDSAYQGFASGDLERDAKPVRDMVAMGAGERPAVILVAQSFAKNMGMYGERVGALHVVMPACGVSDAERNAVRGQLKGVIRRMYSSPPRFGAEVAARVMNDPKRMAAWKEELKGMADRIADVRVRLHDALVANGCPGTWEHVKEQIGMFSYTGLTEKQVEYLTETHHVYLTLDGRISLAGLSEDNVVRFADAVKDAVVSRPKGEP